MTRRRARRQPQRTCVGCRSILGKRDLVRIVRTPSGEIVVDPTGKLAGRGAYLCANRRCWLIAIKHGRISAALKTTLTDEDRSQLGAHAAQLPEMEEASEARETGRP